MGVSVEWVEAKTIFELFFGKEAVEIFFGVLLLYLYMKIANGTLLEKENTWAFKIPE